jgi:hypothetical protein
MNERADVKRANSTLAKADPALPALMVTGPTSIAIRSATVFADRQFRSDTEVVPPAEGLVAGSDYAVAVTADAVHAVKLEAAPADPSFIGGFHFAPGGNAGARSGGDAGPAINPWSVWDANFRPACPDPRGMTLIDAGGPKFWCDIYLLCADHLIGTSRFGQTIADGNDPPQRPDGSRFDCLDYETAVAVMKHHGKGLLGVTEFFAAAYGVTERSAQRKDPRTTGLDAPRTSKWGLMQATGNLWVWGHDEDPDEPRASIFGGSWFNGDSAGSRYANVAYHWPVGSDGDFGARGRGDHLQLD